MKTLHERQEELFYRIDEFTKIFQDDFVRYTVKQLGSPIQNSFVRMKSTMSDEEYVNMINNHNDEFIIRYEIIAKEIRKADLGYYLDKQKVLDRLKQLAKEVQSILYEAKNL